jgi:D-glycero-D-manno-heptose 1,7-bisphosphate phosphatase
MLNTLIGKLNANRDESWMIGDSLSDLQAGVAAGVKTGLVFSPNRCELCPMRDGFVAPEPQARGATLLEVAAAILRRA